MIVDTRILSPFEEKFVHISKMKIIILVGALFGQEKDIQILSIDLDTVTDSLSQMMNREKSLSLEYRLHSFSIDPDRSNYHSLDKITLLDTLIISGGDEIRASVMNQISNPFIIEPIGIGFSEVGETLVQRYYFLRQKPAYEFGLLNNHLAATIHFTPEFESYFSGIFGMSNENNNWEIQGQIDLHLENLIQTAGILDLYWNRTDSLSQIIQFEIMEPHPFGWEVGTHLTYHHEVIGGLYSVIETKSMLQITVPMLNQINVGYSSGKTHPTEKGELNGYEKIRFRAFSFSSSKDTRNKRFLPTQGTKITSSIDAGLQSENGFLKGDVNFEYLHPFTKNVHGLVRWMSHGIHGFDSNIPKSRYVLFGGNSTLRGFREQSFAATQFQIATFEAAFQPGQGFQTNLFLDVGSNRLVIIENKKIGYGFGLTQLNEKSLIKVQYALAFGQGLSNGKLHIKWISRL